MKPQKCSDPNRGNTICSRAIDSLVSVCAVYVWRHDKSIGRDVTPKTFGLVKETGKKGPAS